MVNKPHECQEAHTCCCGCQDLEPREDCPIHGDPWPPKCVVCGRFMKWPKPIESPYPWAFHCDDI